MDEQKQKTDQSTKGEIDTLFRWQRFLGVVYRLVIIIGLVSFAVGFVMVIFTDIIPLWYMAFPILLVIIGIILARFEYVLHKRQKNYTD